MNVRIMESPLRPIENVLILKKFQANIYSHLIIAGIISIGIYFFIGISYCIFINSIFLISIFLVTIQPKFNQIEFSSHAIELYNQKSGHLVRYISLKDIERVDFEYINNYLYGYSNYALVLHLKLKDDEIIILELSNYINNTEEATSILSFILSSYFSKNCVLINMNVIT